MALDGSAFRIDSVSGFLTRLRVFVQTAGSHGEKCGGDVVTLSWDRRAVTNLTLRCQYYDSGEFRGRNLRTSNNGSVSTPLVRPTDRLMSTVH